MIKFGPGDGGGSGPFDVFDGISWGALYSTWKMRNDYSGSCVRIRRASDSTSQDFGFTSTREVDWAAIATFINATSGQVATWYDQSGNGNNATDFFFGGPTVSTGGKYFDWNGDRNLRDSSLTFTPNECWVFATLRRYNYGGGFRQAWMLAGPNTLAQSNESGTFRVSGGGGGTLSNTNFSVNNWHRTAVKCANSAIVRVNGNEVTGSITHPTTDVSGIYLQTHSDLSATFQGRQDFFGLTGDALDSGQIADIELWMKTYTNANA